MLGAPFGWDSVDDALRRRGQLVLGTGKFSDILLPLERTPALSGEDVNLFRSLFDRSSFRKLLRRLTAAHGEPVSLRALTQIAGSATADYVEFLRRLAIATTADSGVVLTRAVDNIGPTLEWYVADLCQRELRGDAAWSVKLEGLPTGGDFDVLAWLAPTLVYIELKSAPPSGITDSELRHFLQRSQELKPELSILLIDTDDSIDPLVRRTNDLVTPLIKRSSGILEPDWQPAQPFIRPQAQFDGVGYGLRRNYFVNSRPKILTKIRRCLQHFHARVKETGFWGGPRINYVTGEIGDEL